MNRMGLMGGRDERMAIRMMVIMMTIMIMVMIMTVLVIRKLDGNHQLMHVCACRLYDAAALYARQHRAADITINSANCQENKCGHTC